MAKSKTNKKKNGQKPDFLDKAIVTAKNKNPALKLNAIAENLTEIGIIGSRQTVYKRYRKSDYLQRSFAEIDEHAQERLMRELEPAASQQIENVVKKGVIKRQVKGEDGRKKTITEAVPTAQIVDVAKHVAKHAWGEKQRQVVGSGVSIGAIQNAQFIIGSDVKPDDTGSGDDSA